MPNPFEKYIQASERQNNKLNTTLDEWANTPSTLHARKDYTLTGQFEQALNRKDTVTEAIPAKSVGDYLGDFGTDVIKAGIILPQIASTGADLLTYAAGGLGSSVWEAAHAIAPGSVPKPVWNEMGIGTKSLDDDFAINFDRAKEYWGNKFYSDARLQQEKESQQGHTDKEVAGFRKSWEDDYTTQFTDLQQSGASEQQLKDFSTGFNKHYQTAASRFELENKTSWEHKSLGENIDAIGKKFGHIADNPSLGVGAAVESIGYMLPAIGASKLVLAAENAARVARLGAGGVGAIQAPSRFLAAAIGEGGVGSLAAMEAMRNETPSGTIDGAKVLAGLAAGASTGLIGGGSAKLLSRVGVDDVDALSLGRVAAGATTTKLPLLVKPAVAIGGEAGEEFLQAFGENIIPNIAMDRDPLHGLETEVALGTFAGGIMGASTNAPSLVTGGFSDISSGLGKVKEAASLKSFDTLSNPEHKNYNPAQAFNIQLKNLESNDETVRTQAEASVSKIGTDLDTARASVEERIKSIQTTLKAMPTSDQTTDAQKLEIEALSKEYTDLKTKSDKLTEHFIGFIEAQVTAQEHRDVKQGTQFTEEQAKADIATLTQPQTSTVMTVGDTQIPVQVEGEAKVLADGIEKVIVNYTDEQGNVKKEVVPTSSLASVESTDTTAQQEALNRVTRHFSKYSSDDLDALSNSPVLSEAQRNSLRVMSESKRQLAAIQDPSQVFDNILNGYKGKTIQESHRGLNQYTDMVNTAVATKNAQLATLALDGLGAFTDDHTAKKDTINEAFGLVQNGTYAEVQTVRTQEGTWGLVPFTAQEVKAGKNAAGANYLSKEALNKVGGLNIHINSDKPTGGRAVGTITQINNETQLIQDRFNALSGVAESFVGVTPKPVDTSTAPIIDTPVVTESSQRSPKLEEAYKETFSKPIENWDANDFASVGAQATHIDPTFDSKTVDADNAFSQKMAKKIIADGIAKNRSTADIMQDVMFVAYSSDFAMKQSGVDALRAYIELRKAQGTSTTPIVTEPLNDTDTEVKNKILSEYPIERLVYGGRSKTAQDAIKAQDLKAMKKAYNLLKAEEQIKLLEANNKKIETELAVKRELFRKTKATKVGDIVTIVNDDDENGGEYKAKILELTKYKTHALLKIKVKSGKEYNISVDQYGDTRTGSITGFVFEAEAPETRPQLLEEINNLKAQIQEVKDTSDYYVDYFKEGSNAPIVTEPSDTPPPVDNPVPKAPVQSDVPTNVESEASINVWAGSNENAGLSNLATRPFTFGTKKYQSVEHAYQTLKSGGFDQQTYDKYAGTENKKIAGNRGTKTTDNANVRLMEKLMTASFEQNKDAMELLQKTGNTVITHTQDKSIWGKEFPRILMEIRESNKAATPSQDTPAVTEGAKQAPTQTTADTEQLTEDLEAKIEARDNIIALHKEYTELDAKDNPTEWEQTRHDYLEDLFSDVIGAVADITYRNEMPSKEIQDELKKLIGEELFNEAMRIRNLPLSERDIAQNLLRQLIPVLRGVPENIDHITLNMLDEAKSEARERAVNRKGEAAGKVFDDVYLKLEKYLKSVETKTPPTKGIGKDTTTATPSDTVSIDKLEATVKSFVKVRDITSEEYKQDTATVYEKQWFKVKTAYNNTVRRLVELVSKGVTTVEDVAALTDILNKLYEFAEQTIDLTSDRAALDKLTQRIDSLATALFSDVSPEIIDAYLKGKTESTERRGDKLTTDRDGAKSFDGRTIEYAFNAPHLQETKTTAPVEAEPSIPETVEGLVKEYGYLGELLADEDVPKVVKDVIETVLEVKAGEKRLTSYSRFVGLFAVHGYIEYFTKQAKNDPNIIKLTKAANKLRNLVRLTQHINFLEDYVDSQNNDDLRAYLNKYPELKSIFSELKVKNPTKGTRSLALDVIADFTQVKNLLTTELGKLVQLVGLMYIQAAFEKGQQYLRDTNYADLNEVLSPTVLALLKGENIGVLAKNKVLGDDAAFRRNSITDVELTFLDKIDGIPVGELSKEDFETVKALVQNAVNAGFNSYEVVNYTRNEEKISSDIVHNIIVEHLPKEGFTLENFTPEEVIKGAVPQSFIWDFEKKAPETTEDTGKDTTEVGFKLTPTGQYTFKDQLKADKATKFIGEGAANSSTAQYAKDAGDKANTGKYTKNDVVFISVNGARANRQAPNLVEIQKAIDAGATILTDKLSDRERSFNVGEREVAAHLTKNGYVEEGNTGVWKPKAKTADTTPPVSDSIKVVGTNTLITSGVSGLTHSVPTKLVDKMLTVKHEIASILQITSSYLNEKQLKYVKELLTTMIGLNDTIRVGFYADLSKINDVAIRDRLKKSTGTSSGSRIYIDLTNSRPLDILELLTHEYHHAVTAQVLDSLTDPKHPVNEALAKVTQVLKDFMNTDPKMSGHIKSRFDNMQKNFKELITTGTTEPQVIARLRTIPVTDTQSAYDVLVEQSIAVMKMQNPKQFTPELETRLNDIFHIGRGQATGNAESSPDSQSQSSGQAIGSPSQDNTGDTTQNRPSDQTPTGQQDSGSGEAVLGTESQDVPTRLATEDAKVTVLQGVTDEVAAEERKKPFNLRNILKGYFTQSATKEGAVGANPLVTVKDFIRNFNVRTQVSDWLNDRRKPTLKQLEQVEHFKKFHAEFARALKFVFNTQASAIFVSNKENLVGYLEMGKKPSTRELDENVVTALALSAYSYLIKQGNKVMNTNEELETLFRLKKGVRAPLHIEQMFRFAGQEMPIVVKALGTDTAKALGLKVREDQDPTLQDRLNTALGILAMEAMAKAGFIVIDTLEGKPLTDFLTAIKTVRESKAHTIEDEYDFEVDTDAETQISKFTMVRPNAKMEGKGNSVFKKGIIETEVDGKIIRTETLTLNRPVLTEGLPTLNSPLVNELIEANKDTKGFLSYLFGVDVGLTTPLKEIPKKFSQRLINGTDASVPSVQAELLTEAQKHSFTMRTNTVAVFAAMQKLGENSQFLKELLGIWIDDHVLSRTHVTERDSLQAKAQNDWTAVLNGLEWAEATLDENGQYQEFYDTQFVAQNQRQHLNSNMFSAQSSQIHRAMAALTGFSTTIDLTKDEQGTVKDEALLNLFYQAVGEGLEGLDDYLKAGILAKAEAGLHQFFTVDKVYGDYYVPALKAFLETTESKSAIEAMRALIETGTIDTTQQKAIAAFVDKGKMGAQSLQSLIALAELSIAQDSKEQIFTTTIGFGSDGVNHGVSAANMLTGVISEDMRQQTGIFPIADKGQVQISNMQEVYKRKITDYYVDFGKVMSAKLRDLIDSSMGGKDNPFVQGMTALFPKFEVLDDTGELRNLLDMRKIAKIWAIPFNYSAGKAALQRALARGFLAGIYGNMNKLANKALDIIDAKKKEGITAEQLAALDLKLATVQEQTNTLQDNLNKVLSKYGMSVKLPEPQLLNEEDKGKLSSDLENTLMQAAIDLHGEAAWKATEEFAKDYLEVRNVYTEVEKASFTLFDVVRNQLIEEKKASRKYTNVDAKVQVKGKTVQYTAEELNAQEAEYFGLTTVEMAEIDAVLAAMRPMFNTALSIGSESTNAADSVTNPSGVSVRKHKMQREPAKGLRAVNTFYLKEIDANRKPFSESRNIGLTKVVEENAGVASSANAIQSIDAFVAAKVQGFMDALNVHDAAIFGLKDFLKGVKKQNEEHLKALTNYQLGLEHAKMLVKVYQGYKAFMATQEEALKSEDVMVKENAQKLITKAKKQMEVLLWGEQMFKGDTALKINNQLVYKGGLIPKLQAANLDIKDNAEIDEAISVFIDYALKQDLQKLEVLLDTHSIHQFAGEGGMHQLTKADKASIEKQKALVQKALLDLDTELNGKPAPMNTTEAVKPTTELAKFLRKAKGAVIDITSLIEHLTNNTDINDLKARAAQLEVLKAITPLIDKATKVIYSEGDYDGYGYYDEETNTLHINSAKEAEGGVRSTLAVHELLHAALSSRIKTLNASIETKEAEAKKTGKEVSFTSAEVALRNLEKLRVNLVTPDGMRMLELQAKLGSAIEDSTQFYKDTEELYESQKAENISTIKELQALNKEEARITEIEGEIKKRGTSIGAAYKAQLEAELKTLTPKAELDTKRNALLTKQQAMRDTKALLDKANKYFELRETLSKKVLSERTRKDGSSSKFTQLNLVEMLTNIDEFISYGLTESRLQEAMKSTQVDRGGRTFSAKLRKFVEFVGQILGFRSKEISALAAFASDTAALLETIGSVTPVVAPNNGERLFSTQSAEDLVNGQSSLDIMTALPHSNTGAFNQQLDRLIVGEIGQLYNQDDAAKARIDEIQTFTASDALNAGFSLSRKEQYVQQALQYAVAAYMKLHAGGANVGQLNRVYHAAKAKMDATGKDFHEGDWTTATQQEKDIAKAKYDFLFDATKADYMSRFVSMALASESVNKLLDIALPLTKPDTQDKTWFETVSDWVSYVMAWLTNKYVRLNPIAGASNQLSQLMDNLVKLDIRNRQEGVALHQKAWNTIGLVTTPLNKALKGAGGAVLSGVGLRDSRFLPVRALGAILVLRSEEAAKAIPKMIIDMRNNQLPNTKLGEVANILLEASGVGTLRDKFDVLIRQTNLNAKNRQDIVDGVKKAVNKWFKTPLTKAQNKAIAYGLLGTDAQALLENYSVEDIVDMALHEGKLNVEIAKLKKEIAKNPNGNDMLNAAEQLGYYMVTRIGGEGLVKNALGIAIGLGTQYFTPVEQADPKLVSQLNTLVSMLAMTHVPNSDKAILAALYKTDAEGIHATIQLHQGLVNDSLKDFQANPLNMVKGWMPEVTNPYLEIKAASEAERPQMLKEGWKEIGKLKRDPEDFHSRPKYLMKHNDIGYQRLVSGAVDLGSTARSGTEAISRTSPDYLGITQARYQNAARRAAIPNSSFDPSKQPRGLIAAYDTDGGALAYNYEMDNETRDAHLDRKHNIGDLLGTFGGLNYYKPEKTKQSNKVAEVLFEDYKANYSQNPNAYLKISHKSTDPKVVEMWRMLPQDFRQRATELYGKGNPIIIRNEAFNLAFGFKKFSVVSYAFDAVKAERERIKKGLDATGKSPNKFQSAFVGFAERLRGNTAQADFAKAEHVVQEIVKAIKDFIVIRSGTTMMWNIFANVLMLMANGINPVTIIKDWVFAVTNVRAYQKLNSQLIQAQADLAGGKDPIALKQRIGALKAELKANVMNPYINAGLFSSIVDDVNIQHGEYTYTSSFKQTVDEKTRWIPKPVKTAAAIATIAPSTKLYQFLATTTQLSDFVAKYSMSKHLQANGTDIDASIIEASKTFINYDVPTSQGLQYANDMGLFMFTKFFLRIQAVLMKLLGKRAGSTIAQHLLVENLTGAEGILSPIAYGHIDNIGIESSVLGLPSAFFSIGTIDAVTDFGVSF